MEIELIISHSELETFKAGEKFAERLNYGSLAIFSGELGAGKTQFIKGICHFFDVAEDVTSPSFTIINQYTGTLNNEPITIFNIDLYRMSNKSELASIGFDELIYDDDSIKLVEWPEIAEQLLADSIFRIEIRTHPEEIDTREISISKI